MKNVNRLRQNVKEKLFELIKLHNLQLEKHKAHKRPFSGF